jgi:hypothetical protein
MIVTYKRLSEGEVIRKFTFQIGVRAFEKRRDRINTILQERWLSVASSYRNGKFVYVADLRDAAIIIGPENPSAYQEEYQKMISSLTAIQSSIDNHV